MNDLLPHLQFFVLREISHGEKSGTQLRKALDEIGVKSSKPAFYQLVARLKGLVTRRFESTQINNQWVTQSLYTITDDGRAAIQRSIDFYSKGNLDESARSSADAEADE